MKTNHKLSVVITMMLAVTIVGGCGYVKKKVGKKDINYQVTRSVQPLEVPPDLSSSSIQDEMLIPGRTGSASYSDYQGRQSHPGTQSGGLLPEQKGIRLEGSGGQRWLVLDGTPEQVWPRVREFWLKNGFLIAKENARTGIMETDWAESRARVKNDFITNFFSKFLGGLYSSGLRDKFRVRLERGKEEATTELYLTHRGMVERATDLTGGEAVETVWEARPVDPELEAEMLRELMVYIGVDKGRAKTIVAGKAGSPAQHQQRARLESGTNGARVLHLDGGFDDAWRRLGLSLDRISFTVVDRNRSEGIYYVRYIDTDEGTKKKKGFLKRVFSRGGKKRIDKDEFQVKLEASGDTSQVTVRDKKGAPEKSKTGATILKLLYEQLR
ncbi:MAG TPA: outer membrane protein assembly factor BamC [Acidiferrobacteraceae bacterium]|nr:outer membrane protein assembly factor BamC [Acidiferrobacteraceae bacterium]